MERENDARPDEAVAEEPTEQSALSKAAALGPLPGIHDEEVEGPADH